RHEGAADQGRARSQGALRARRRGPREGAGVRREGRTERRYGLPARHRHVVSRMPRVTLVLGPLLRYAGTESATFWVETSTPCEVEILGARTRTFTVEGHHYALLLVDDLEPGSVTPYEVRLDGELVRLVFGSCRRGGPQPDSLEAPWDGPLAREGVDALWSYSRALQRGEAEWP